MIPSTANGRPVKNLGWLLRHWKDVTGFVITDHPPVKNGIADADCVLVATLHGGGEYKTGFASHKLLTMWLDRPVFRGVPVQDKSKFA